ncbi:MAG: hypothetical protein Q9208_008663 [Pyrenodesmia sp. 3 TL-2023]
MAVTGKREIEEADTDDEDTQTQEAAQPRKQAKNSQGMPWVVPGQQQQTSRGSNSQSGPAFASGPYGQPFPVVPPAPRKKSNASPKKPRGAPPATKPKGMGSQEPWDAAQYIQDTVISLSLAQFFHYAPKARMAFAESMRLELNLNRKKPAKKTRFAEGMEDEVSLVEHIYSAEVEHRHDWQHCSECAKNPTAQAVNETMKKLATQGLSTVKPLMIGYFYTYTTI